MIDVARRFKEETRDGVIGQCSTLSALLGQFHFAGHKLCNLKLIFAINRATCS